jgi:ABC-type phosphate transport system auxiliary subunit
MTQKTEALRLAECLERDCEMNWPDYDNQMAAAAELRRLHAVNEQLLEALDGLEKEFRRVYPIYYYAEPWGHETNVPLQVARAAIAAAKGQA